MRIRLIYHDWSTPRAPSGIYDRVSCLTIVHQICVMFVSKGPNWARRRLKQFAQRTSCPYLYYRSRRRVRDKVGQVGTVFHRRLPRSSLAPRRRWLGHDALVFAPGRLR